MSFYASFIFRLDGLSVQFIVADKVDNTEAYVKFGEQDDAEEAIRSTTGRALDHLSKVVSLVAAAYCCRLSFVPSGGIFGILIRPKDTDNW